MADPVTITLKEPIQHGSETVTELTFRAPKAKDMRGFPMEGAEVGHVLTLISRLCGQPTSVIDELGGEDLMTVAAHIGNFIPGGRKIGKKPSR